MGRKTTPRKDLTMRKRRFLAALDLAGHTQTSWAAQEGITVTHLYLVLSGQRESARLLAKVDAFIAEQLAAASAA